VNERLEIARRLGPAPVERRDSCALHRTCPDVFVLSNGDFAIIGTDITADLAGSLPNDAGCSPNERIILLPRSVLLAVKAEIPDV
jgi:hypothetical protein